ncbi:MAG TPA: DUF4253 domain-containing protein [Abditibacterium sp.]|jgi:hypothetical protein
MELSNAEIALCREVDFDTEVALALKRITGNAVERAYGRSENDWELQPIDALSSLNTTGSLSELQATIPSDYRAYWGIRREENGLESGRELVVLKDQDPMAFVRLRRPDGINYDVTPEDVLVRLQQWHSLYQIEILGADHDQVELSFGILPENLMSFAEEVYWFCTDVTEADGDEYDEDDPDFARALELPDVSREFAEKYIAQMKEFFGDYQETEWMGIKLLAANMEKSRNLFLWWD